MILYFLTGTHVPSYYEHIWVTKPNLSQKSVLTMAEAPEDDEDG